MSATMEGGSVTGRIFHSYYVNCYNNKASYQWDKNSVATELTSQFGKIRRELANSHWEVLDAALNQDHWKKSIAINITLRKTENTKAEITRPPSDQTDHLNIKLISDGSAQSR